MKNWKTKTALYEIHETSKKHDKVYEMVMTGEQISRYCKARNEMNGFIEGLGGDKHYSCWAVEIYA